MPRGGAWERAVPSKKNLFLPENGMIWCILMHYFRAPMREETGFGGRGYNPGNFFLKFQV